MASTPVSLNDESLNGSWIDINSASQIHSPMEDEPPEFLSNRTPSQAHQLAESMQSLGLISFQVERFLQEAQRNQNNNQPNTLTQQPNPSGLAACGDDNNSGLYSSDTDISIDDLDSKAFIHSLRKNQHLNVGSESNNNLNDPHHSPKLFHHTPSGRTHLMSKSGGDCLVDQLSDSLSMLSRASVGGVNGEPSFNQAGNFQDFDWLWDWTAQPEYFTGQEWKVYAPKQEYLMRQRQLYCENLNQNHSVNGTLFSGEVMSLLFLTNILSIIIGAGLTYSILMRRSAI